MARTKASTATTKSKTTTVRKKKKDEEQQQKVSPRFYTQEGASTKPSGNGSGRALTTREIAEYKRKAKAKKKGR